MLYLRIGTLFSSIELFFTMFFDFMPRATEASFHTVDDLDFLFPFVAALVIIPFLLKLKYKTWD